MLEIGGRLAVERHRARDPGPGLEPEAAIAAEVAPVDDGKPGIGEGHEREVPLLRREREPAVRPDLGTFLGRSLWSRISPFWMLEVVDGIRILGRHEVHETLAGRGAVGIGDGAADRLRAGEPERERVGRAVGRESSGVLGKVAVGGDAQDVLVGRVSEGVLERAGRLLRVSIDAVAPLPDEALSGVPDGAKGEREPGDRLAGSRRRPRCP